jgi:hypothetical protein
VFSVNPKAKVAIQLKASLGEGEIRSFSALDVVSCKDKLKMLQIYMEVLNFRGSYYNLKNVKSFIFSYRILKDSTPTKYPSDTANLKKSKRKFINYGITTIIPKNMKTHSWGPLVNISGEIYICVNNSLFVQIKKKKGGENTVRVYSKALGTLVLVCTFKDYLGKNPRDLTTFKRVIKDKVIYYVKGEVSLLTKIIQNIKFIPKALSTTIPSDKVITMDFETKEIDNLDLNIKKEKKLDVVCASLYTKGMDKPLNFKI